MDEGKVRHLAGVIPVNSQPMDFNFPWADCLQPIAPNFLSIERAVLECATAGCETIWIACPYGIQPLLKHRIGELVHDPLAFSKAMFTKKPEMHKKEIPIYYIPVSPRDQDKRDSIVWNFISACLTIRDISGKMSEWLIPDKYYICFPNVVYPSQYILKHRKDLALGKRFLITYRDQSILDGLFLAGTFTLKDINILKREFRDQATGAWDGSVLNEKGMPANRLPIENRYSGRFLTIKDIFSKLPDSETVKMSVDWYYPLDNWENLCLYLSSSHRHLMKRPDKPLLKYKELKGIAND